MLEDIGSTLSFLLTFSLLGWLIHRFAKGKIKKVLYAILAYYAGLMIVDALLGRDVVMAIMKITACVITACLLLVGTFKICELCINSGYINASKPIAVLKGYHICGLAANEGVKVSLCLFDDGIIIRSGRMELESIKAADVLMATSFSEQEIVGTVTTGRKRAGLASTIALMNGDFAAAYFLRPKTTTYKTKNKVKRYWFLRLETITGTIVLQSKSRSAVYHFVNLCNEVIHAAALLEEQVELR